MPPEPVPATAFADAWIQVDRTADPSFFVRLLDSTRAAILERARRSPAHFIALLNPIPGLRVLEIGCGTGDFLRLLGGLVAPGTATGIDLSENHDRRGSPRTRDCTQTKCLSSGISAAFSLSQAFSNTRRDRY